MSVVVSATFLFTSLTAWPDVFCVTFLESVCVLASLFVTSALSEFTVFLVLSVISEDSALLELLSSTVDRLLVTTSATFSPLCLSWATADWESCCSLPAEVSFSLTLVAVSFTSLELR